MSASIAPRHATVEHLNRVLAWLDRIGDFGLACFDRLVASSRAPVPIAAAHAPHHDPATAVERFGRGMIWAICLGQLLSGTYCLPPARPRRPPTEPDPGLPPSQGSGAAPRRAYKYAARTDDPVMNAAFRTRPVGKIVEAICGDLGIGPSHALWPADLVAITQTAADWTASVLAERPRAIRAPATPFATPPPASQATNPPPPDPRAAPSQRAP